MRFGPVLAALLLIATAGCDATPLVGPESSQLRPDALQLDRGRVAAVVGDTVWLRARGPDRVGGADAPLAWSVDDPEVAVVEDGLVVPLRAGRVRVRVTDGARSAASEVRVSWSDIFLAEVRVVPDAPTLTPGESMQLAASVRFSNDITLMLRTALSWTSLDPAVATVAGGVLMARTPGTARIVASIGGRSDTALVTVGGGISPGRHRTFYVSPTGMSITDGSPEHPWDLKTALSHPPAVRPGDTIYVRGGSYRGTFASKLTGSESEPIVVRQYPGERAVINANGASGNVLTINGGNTIFWGLEITDSLRNSAASSGEGVFVLASGIRLVNLVVHDVGGEGIGYWSSALGGEVYGSLIYNNGWQGSDRGHGHGIYSQNRTGVKRFTDNIIFQQFGWGIHIYGSSAASLRGYHIEGNTVFDNGSLSTEGGHENLLVGGGSPAGGITVHRNVFYRSTASGASNLLLGYGSSPFWNNDVSLTENLILGGGSAFTLGNWRTATIERNTVSSGLMIALSAMDMTATRSYQWGGNTYLASASSRWRYGSTSYTWSDWLANASLGVTDRVVSGEPDSVAVIVRPNIYEPGRANITVVNWTASTSVSVDVSSVLRPGDRYELRDARDFFGAPVVSGVHAGGWLSIAPTPRAAAQPIGGSPRAPAASTPRFGAYVLLRLPPLEGA